MPGKLGAKVDDCTGQYALNPIERTIYAIDFLAADGSWIAPDKDALMAAVGPPDCAISILFISKIPLVSAEYYIILQFTV